MKENKYDDGRFFDRYCRMARSEQGLRGAGEWYELRKLMPDFEDKRVLDLGCGFGWHCRYAVDNGAVSVLGIDISRKMIEEAGRRNPDSRIKYECRAVEDMEYTPDTYDIVISSLTFHYLADFEKICHDVRQCLTSGGSFVFSVEHPVFTSYGNQDWAYDSKGNKSHWPVDRYFEEGKRDAVFLGEHVLKYHKTLTTYVNGLLRSGFEITALVEPEPEDSLLDTLPGMRDELRRPMMLLISAVKK